MKNTLICLMILSFSLLACTKGKADFTLKGTITDATFQNGLAGGTITLYATEAGTGITDEIASAILDVNGAYSFTFPRDKVETYYIKVEKNNYFNIYETIPFSSLSVENDNERNYSTTAKGWVKFHIVNNNPLESDVLEYIRQEGKSDCEECCPSGYRYYYGTVDTTFYCINDGNSVYSGYYWVQGGGNQGPIWAVTPPFDTVAVEISY